MHDDPEQFGAAAGATGKLRLSVAEGSAAGAMIEISDELVLGRHAEGDGRLGADPEISRRHARIFRMLGEPRYLIEDLGSTNGTFVNGHRLTSPEALEAGDRIELGETTLVVQVGAVQVPEPADSSDTAERAVETAAPQEQAVAAEQTAEARGEAAVPANLPAVELPLLSLRIEVDPAAGTAVVRLDEESDAVKLSFEEGRWRIELDG